MSGEKLQAPRGTFDVLPEQAAARGAVEREASRIFEAAGYGRIETPTLSILAQGSFLVCASMQWKKTWNAPGRAFCCMRSHSCLPRLVS